LSIYPVASTIVPGWNDIKTLFASFLRKNKLPFISGYRSEVISSVVEVVAMSDTIFPASAFLSTKTLSSLVSIPMVEFGHTASEDVRFYMHYRNQQDPYHLYVVNLVKEIESDLKPIEWQLVRQLNPIINQFISIISFTHFSVTFFAFNGV